MGPLRRVAERFWFVPGVMCLLAVLLSEALITLDAHLDEPLASSWSSVLFYRIGESGTRDILGTIATASLGVAGTTFSITMAVLALTSSSYGPRLVRNFMADRANQTVLGVFVATFLYSLLVLRSVGAPSSSPDGSAAFVPHLAVNTAIVLAVANVAAMVYFIHHISDSIQIATLSGGVRTDLLRVIDREYPEHGSAEVTPEPPGREGPAPTLVRAGRHGYVQMVRTEELLRLASRHDVRAVLLVRVGEYVLSDTPVLQICSTTGVTGDVCDGAQAQFTIGNARSPHQDVDFAVQQLTEMAVRALSPGTNDPNTAINALDDLSAGLAVLASRQVPPGVLRDSEGTARVWFEVGDPAGIVGGVLDHLRWHASQAPSVMHAALTLVQRVGARAGADPLRAELGTQVQLLRDAFSRAGHHPHDVAEFDAHALRVAHTLTG